MKRILAIVLSIVMCLSFTSCGDVEEKSHFDVESEIRSRITSTAKIECITSYNNVKNVTVSCTTIRDNGNDTYTIYGSVNITDNYGDKYVGKFDAEASVDLETEYVSITSFDLETPTKQR